MSIYRRLAALEVTQPARTAALVWVDYPQSRADALAAHLAARPENQGCDIVFIGWQRPGHEYAAELISAR